MGILNSVATKVVQAAGGNLNAQVQAPPKPDFEAFSVQELVNGQLKDVGEDGFGFNLIGSFMPIAPFEFGGSQQVNKEYYPGSDEATVQVLGARESDVVIKGRFYLKRFNRPNTPNEFRIENAQGIAEAYQRQVDDVRRRGNVLRLQLGEWVRWGILEETKFNMKRLVDIEYELKFTIMGLSQPRGCRQIEAQADDPQTANSDLAKAAAAALANVKNFPSEMPRTLADFLNDKIGDVAEVVAVVTEFVDGAIDDANQLLNTANRALGMIKYARAFLSRTLRQIGAISYQVSNLGSSFSNEADKITAQIKNAKFINDTKVDLFNLAAFLAALQLKFQKIAETIPVARHIVVEGDTLQKISVKYYGTQDNWNKIYSHNKLTSTDLTKGSVLEIPR